MAQVGLNDLHFAILTADTKDELTYEPTEALVGAINATINPAVNTQELYADDQLWESVSALGKVDVEIETAELPLTIRAKLLGNELKNGVLIEKATDVPPHIALGFKSLKSNGKYRYVWLLKGVAQPMAEDFSTKKDNVEHKTPKVKFTFMARVHDGEWKHTADEDGQGFTGFESWFSRVPGDTSPVVVDKSALIATIGEAEDLLAGATVGTGIGEYPQEAYDTFSDAIDAAQAVVDDENATQAQVDAALATLAVAVSAFEATIITEEG
jgi:phi13 family phage major tail protein